jgi:hypothetical protein
VFHIVRNVDLTILRLEKAIIVIGIQHDVNESLTVGALTIVKPSKGLIFPVTPTILSPAYIPPCQRK